MHLMTQWKEYISSVMIYSFIKMYASLLSYRGAIMNHMIYLQYCTRENCLYIML